MHKSRQTLIHAIVLVWATMATSCTFATGVSENCQALFKAATSDLSALAAKTGRPEHLLQVAVLTGDLNQVRRLIQTLAPKAASGGGQTATEARYGLQDGLIAAAWTGNQAALSALLQAGVSADGATPWSSPAIVVAASCGQTDAIDALVHSGASVYAGRDEKAQYNVPNGTLEAALVGGHFDTAEWLLNHGFDACKGNENARLKHLLALPTLSKNVPGSLKTKLACGTSTT